MCLCGKIEAAMMPDFKRFSAIGMFADFNLRQLTTIFEKTESVIFKKSDVILDSKSTRIGLYFVIEGTVKIYSMVEDQELAISVLQPGDSFGEISVVEGGAPSATVRAEEDSVLYFLSQHSFRDLVESNSVLGAKMWESLTRLLISRVKKTNATIQEYFGLNKALCENPKFREFYQLCQFGR